MPYVLPDGRRVAPDGSFKLLNAALNDTIQYPAGWLKSATQAERDARGITWEADPAPQDPAIDLAVLKATLRKQVDTDAERIRLKYITDGSGMAMTYQEKHAQALAVVALGEVPANALTAEQRTASYPTLAASVGLEAATLLDCAQLVLTKYAQFAALSNAIEGTRLAGKKAIADAADVAAVKAAYNAIVWTV